jgi:hypothetical protein
VFGDRLDHGEAERAHDGSGAMPVVHCIAIHVDDGEP